MSASDRKVRGGAGIGEDPFLHSWLVSDTCAGERKYNYTVGYCIVRIIPLRGKRRRTTFQNPTLTQFA